MKRTQIYLGDDQDARIARKAEASGVTKSELIRRAIDEFLQGPSDRRDRMRRLHAALDEIESSPLDLPDGKAYVEALRAADVRRQDEIDRRRA